MKRNNKNCTSQEPNSCYLVMVRDISQNDINMNPFDNPKDDDIYKYSDEYLANWFDVSNYPELYGPFTTYNDAKENNCTETEEVIYNNNLLLFFIHSSLKKILN